MTEQITPPEETTTPQTPAVQGSTGYVAPLNPGEEKKEEKKVSNTKKKKLEKERKRLTISFGKMMEKHTRKQQQINVQMERLKEQVGKKEYAVLKTLATVAVPEKKDEKGEVIQKGSSYLNHDILFREGANLVTIQREGRMKAGVRKRTTGRSSKRKAHKMKLKAIIARNEELSKPKTEAATPAGNSSETTQNS